MIRTKTANDIVKLARSSERITTREFINEIFDNFVELHGDRYFGDDGAVIGGIAYLEKQSVTVIGIQKGRDLEENIATNFGSPSPEGYRKSLRLMKQAEKFNRPIITFVNTPGAFCGIEAEERGEGEAIANNLYEMSQLKVPIISIFTGEGGSGGAIALALADEVWMLEHSIYSILSPEGFASILWKDSSKADEAAEIMKLTAYDLKELGVIEKIIAETDNQQDKSSKQISQNLKNELINKLNELQQLDDEILINQRYDRFRKF
ncbi:MAG: acetyl-CoA carboxylase carboxyl transferase subunit alpha [Vagococcus sp.]|uniref:acetyl-CoA carboxylase carboxyl transferase subunit alpha n=1 Tax=Vagococcus sp. TaxID=1933889 RepID=UPI002FCA19A8